MRPSARVFDPASELETLRDELIHAENRMAGADAEGKAELRRQIREIAEDIARITKDYESTTKGDERK